MSRHFSFPRVEHLDDLVPGFDARFGPKQFVPYWTQLPEWWTARDVAGRTPFMVGIQSNKGAKAELFLRPEARDALLARDVSGRNLWAYAWRSMHYGGKSQRAQWQQVLAMVPFEINPFGGSGLFTDALLNGLPPREKLGCWRRPTLGDILPVVSKSSEPTSSEAMTEWAGRGLAAWWACPPERNRLLFETMLDAKHWPSLWSSQRRQSFDDALYLTLGSGETDEQLPPGWRAVRALVDLLAHDTARGLVALERGDLDGFLGTDVHRRALGRIVTGRSSYASKAYQKRVASGDVAPIDTWWARVRERHLDLRLGTVPAGAARAIPRL